jgi:hypothetical protein
VTVVEYYNRTLNTYFITGRTAEQQMLDQVADFRAHRHVIPGAQHRRRATRVSGICRFYVSIASPFTNSHFYGRQQVDCEPMAEAAYAGFSWEDMTSACQAAKATAPALRAQHRCTAAFAWVAMASHPTIASLCQPPPTTLLRVPVYRGEGQVFCASGVPDAR